jgi:hypothetical protein
VSVAGQSVIVGLVVAANATDDAPRRLVAEMAMLSPSTNAGRSKAFISVTSAGKTHPSTTER